jgi:hypothetical protein
MNEKDGPAFLRKLDPAVVATLPVHCAFARSALESAIQTVRVGGSSFHRATAQGLAAFYKPVTKPLAFPPPSDAE